MKSSEKIAKGRAVRETEEFRRIDSLPRRDWRENRELDLARDALHGLFRKPGCDMDLYDIQVAALLDLFQLGALTGPIDVGGGKALRNGTKVRSEFGWTSIEDLRVGDRVFGSDGRLHKVTGVYPQGVRPVFRMTFSDRTHIDCDGEHLWRVRDQGSNGGKTIKVKTTESLLEAGLFRWAPNSSHKIWRWFLPITEPLQLPPQDLPLDPYTLGALMGDGGFEKSAVYYTSMDRDIVDGFKLPEGVVAVDTMSEQAGQARTYRLVKENRRKKEPNPLLELLRSMGIGKCKSVDKRLPDIYMRGSIEQRLALLQGLLDSDGEWDKSQAIFSSVSTDLAYQVKELAESLGANVTLVERQNPFHYRVSIRLPWDMEPFRCKRQLERFKQSKRQRPPGKSIRSIESIGEFNATCISVDSPDRCFLAEHHIVTHNTLLTLLSSQVLRLRQPVERPLLLVPASLKKKTEYEIRHFYAPRWHLDPKLRIESVERLSHPDHKRLLLRYQPDLVILDESQAFKSKQAACTKRLLEWYRKFPDTPIVNLTGTMLERSLQDCWHLVVMSQKEVLCPLPLSWMELQDWCNAIDSTTLAWDRIEPGPLSRWCEEGETVEEGFARRFVSTPGVVSGGGSKVGVPLIIRMDRSVKVPSGVRKMIVDVRDKWELPSGEILMEQLAQWRAMCELALGYWSRWEPPPPEEWVEARREWGRYVIHAMRYRGYDSEAILRRECEAMEDPPPEYSNWAQVEPNYTPNRKIEWVSDFAIDWGAKWLKKNPKRGIVWAESPVVGERLAKAAGVTYYGAGEKAAEALAKEAMKSNGASCVMSRRAHYTGKNLQTAWHKCLVLQPVAKAAIWEQLTGRVHRQGQTADAVEFIVPAYVQEQIDTMERARDEAKWMAKTSRRPQRLDYCTFLED